MYPFFKRLSEKYYLTWLKFINLQNKIKILPVDFSKSWTKIILIQKKFLALAMFLETLTQIFYIIVPLLIGWIFENKNFSYFYILIAVWLLAIIGEYISSYYTALLEIQCINSIQYNAFKFFLTVDPIYHSQKESGKLFAKIERAARAYEDYLDIVLWDLIPIIIGICTIVTSFSFIDIKMSILSFILLILVALLNIVLNLLHTIGFEQNLIKADDEVKNISVESLTQVQLIRSYYASDEISQKAKNKNIQFMFEESASWIAFGAINFITRLTYLASIFFLGLYMIYLIKINTLTITLATTLILTYLRGTYEIIKIGRRVRKLLRSVTRIKDLFTFIQNFGKQTFAVLEIENTMEEKVNDARQKETIHLEVTDLYFDYNPKAQIFENHNLNIQIHREQKNKLYGIIGPSGIGKTTLISILGGQLKPTRGTIKLNDVEIYKIDDHCKKKIIAMQGQIASTLSGTIRKNLLLGLPDKQTYSDEEMITVLKDVGIWNIFEEKEGLNTKIGEGGITLSGGQRQRLNFASLYLRASYFRPLLILIDEPTSSLDEISEQAITKMISKLAQYALTLVIAHRLKTLEDVVGILDFSLIEQEKDITFYPKEKLIQKSVYFKKLIQGQINIEI